ncbi:MAG: glycosyltransferase family 4 protein [Bacteriovoracaceae bacterium]|nr:glycosyltransferase family 4 protein [Bacteriovoracaceae bacterium]
MTRIIIEMEKIQDPYSGLGQFCHHLGVNLINIKEKKELDLKFYMPKKNFLAFDKVGTIPLRKIHKTLPFLLPKADLWHATHQDSPYMPKSSKTKYLLTIHDLNFLFEKDKNINPRQKQLNLKSLQNKINRADGLVFISAYTKKLVEQHLTIPPIPTFIVYNGISLRNFEVPKRPEYVPEGKFLLSLGAILPKKNFHLLVPLLKLLPNYNFILAGSTYHPYAAEIDQMVQKQNLRNRFIMPGKISEEDKFWLYQNCEALVFPSALEGFGMPIVEAMYFGKPLFLSRLSCLPEIGGDDAYYFDNLSSPWEMADNLLKGINEFKLSQDRSIRLINRSKRYCWQTAAQSYLNIYHQLLFGR